MKAMLRQLIIGTGTLVAIVLVLATGFTVGAWLFDIAKNMDTSLFPGLFLSILSGITGIVVPFASMVLAFMLGYLFYLSTTNGRTG